MLSSTRRLFEASLNGDVGELHQLIKENPLILADYSLVSPHENPLHVATKAMKLSYVKEIVKLKPEFVKELNKDGFRPLDIASALGHVEIVKVLIKGTTTTSNLCRLKGRDGRTAIHYAAMSGKIEVIDVLISSCKECVEDLTCVGETSLHLAVKFNKFQAFTNLVEWIQRIGEEEIVNWGDNDGNTVLHLAVATKQHQMPYIPSEPLPFTVGFGVVLANLGTLAASEMFLFGNSLGLTASLNVIIYLTAGFPFQRELHISIYSMLFAYGWSVQGLESSENSKVGMRNVILGFAFLLPFVLRWFPRWGIGKRIRLWWINKMIMIRNTRVQHYPTLW
uniref:Uncharacterized protein n=1 Tax=Cannabis sativa TaxID=3483 RepID=A0A803NH61_CANSA